MIHADWRATSPDGWFPPPTRANPLSTPSPARWSPGSPAGLDLGDGGPRPHRRRAGAAGADLPRAGRPAQGAGQAPRRAQGRVLRRCPAAPAPPAATARSTSTAASAPCSLRQQGHPRAARRHRRPRRRRRAARQARHLRRPAPLHAAARGGGADQRLQLPGLGLPREARPGLPRRRPDDRQAGQPDRRTSPSRSSAGSSSRASCPRARCSCSPAAPAGLLDQLTVQDLVGLHRLRAHRRHAAHHPSVLPRRRRGSTSRPTRSTARSSAPTCGRRRPRVRPVRQARRHRDDGQGRPEVHRHPPGPRAAALQTPSSRRLGARLARSSSATRATRRARWAPLVSLDQRDEVREAVKSLRGGAELVVGDPDDVEVVGADPTAVPSCRRCCCAAPTGRASSRTTSRRSGRSAPCSPTTASTTPSTLAARGRAAWSASRRHPRPGRRPPARARARAVARPHPGARPRRRQGVHRPRLAAARARPRRPGSRRRRRGARRHPRRAAPHAAHRRPGLARHADRVTGRWTTGATRARRRRPPVPQVPGRAADRRLDRLGRAPVTLRRHRALRRVHRRHVLRAHGRGGGRGQPAVRRPSWPTAT